MTKTKLYIYVIMNLNFGAYSLTMFYRLKDKQKDSKEPLDSIMVTLPGIEPGLPG